MSYNQCFSSIGIQFRKQCVRNHGSRYPPEEQKRKPQCKKTWVCDVRRIKGIPWHDGAQVKKCTKGEERRDGWINSITPVVALFSVKAVPVECVAGREAGKEIFRTNCLGATEDEELVCLSQGGFRVLEYKMFTYAYYCRKEKEISSVNPTPAFINPLYPLPKIWFHTFSMPA